MTAMPRLFSFPKPEIGARGDIVVVGAGLAGLFTALELAPMRVTVVAAAPLGDGASSAWAQGGIAAALSEGDTPEQHAADTIRAGAGLVDAEIARGLAAEAPSRIADLLRYGVPFDREADGALSVAREAAHGRRRIVHVKGDQAGRAIMTALIAAVRRTPSIRVLKGFAACGLELRNGRVVGVRLRSVHSGAGRAVPARAVVLATGGIGHLYSVTTNPVEARGQGLALAAKAGAAVADAEFVQFHPTAIACGRDPAPLATEALRGEGATLVNGRGERFMPPLHPDAELAPRDLVAEAVHGETVSGRGAYLDCRAAIGAHFADHFPGVYAACRSLGIDPAADLIPVAPAAHYHMGGVATDAYGRTSVPGLWACGEVASTGAHGANRLASNSLLEAAVFGSRIAKDIAGAPTILARPGTLRDEPAQGDLDPRLVSLLRQTMSHHVGVLRDRTGLATALGVLRELDRAALSRNESTDMIVAAKLVTTFALLREESRGAHLRADFPSPSPTLAHRTFARLDEVDLITAETAIGPSPANIRIAIGA